MSLDSLERVRKRKEDERGVEGEGVMMIPEQIRDMSTFARIYKCERSTWSVGGECYKKTHKRTMENES